MNKQNITAQLLISHREILSYSAAARSVARKDPIHCMTIDQE